MKVAVHSFGSIWTRRFGRDAGSAMRYTKDAAFYNTTGVMVGARLRARSRVYGVARFNGASGFMSHVPQRMRNRVFECSTGVWNGANRVLFESLLEPAAAPDLYLVAVHESDGGWIDRGCTWFGAGCELISFSESDLHQEGLLLVPPFGWVRGRECVVILQPDVQRRTCARLVRAI